MSFWYYGIWKVTYPDFFDKVSAVKEYGILDEFIGAAREEEHGLQKIIKAYDKRITNQFLP